MPEPLFHTLTDILTFRARTTPEQPAFFFEEKACSWQSLLSQSRAVAGMLQQAGVQPADRVLIAIPNGPGFFAAFFASLLLRAVAVPVFPGSGPERLEQLSQLCGARLILRPQNLHEARPCADLPSPSPGDPALIQYTSGTTSDPKGVVLTHANILTNIRQMIAGMAITEREVFVSWLPVYHDMGLVLQSLTPFYLGLKLVLLPTTLHQVHRWLRAIQDHRGTFTAAPDIAYRLALQWVRAGHTYDLSSLRIALNAAEPVRLSTIRAFESTFELQGVMTAGYGLAEATVGVSMSPPGAPPLADADGHVSCGRPFPDIALGVMRDDHLLGPGQVGEILVKSPANTTGYFQNPAATRALHWRNGYIRTGDAGYLDEAGNLYVLERQKQVLKVAGRTLYAADIEETMEQIPDIRQAMALGIEGKAPGGEQLFAFAETRWHQPPQMDALKELSRQIVEAIHSHFGLRPARVCLLKPRSLPFTFNGKKQHHQLKIRYKEGSLRREGHILFPDF